MDTGIGHQVGLELCDIHVQGAIETEGSGQRRDDLGDEAIEVGVGGAFDVQGATADVVDCFVVEHDGNIGMLQERMSGEDGVVRLDDGGGDLGRGIDGEAELGFLAVVDGETFQEERAKTGTSTTTNGIEHEEALETGTVVGELADTVEAGIDNLLADGIVTTSKVVGSVFLSTDELLGVEELSVGAGADFVNHGRFEIDKDAAGDVFSSASLGEEGVESVVAATDGFVSRHGSIRLDAMLETVELPACITDLDTGLALYICR